MSLAVARSWLSGSSKRVMRLTREFRKVWSMLSSQGEPGARKELYRSGQCVLAMEYR